MKWTIYVLIACSAVATVAQQKDDDELNIALLRPVTTLNPYYNEGIETESIVNILFDAVYVSSESTTKPSYAQLSGSASPSSLERTLEVEDDFIRWMPEYREFVRPDDVRFTFYYLNGNKASNNTHSDNYIRGFRTIDDKTFKILLRTPPDIKTLKQQLDFKILPARFAKEHIAVYNLETKQFRDSRNEREAREILAQENHSFLKIKDVLVAWEPDNYFTRVDESTLRIFFEKEKLGELPGRIFDNLNLGEVAYSFYVYQHLFEGLGKNLGIEEIEPLNDGLAAVVTLQPNVAITNPEVNRFLEMPILFRDLDSGMTHTRAFWGKPEASYKFSIEDKAIDLISLKREKSRVPGKDRSQLSVQKINCAFQAGSDIASIRSGFRSGGIDMILNISPSLGRRITSESVYKLQTKGSHIEMIALNCIDVIADRTNPLSDPRVRLALNYLLDKKELHFSHAPQTSAMMHGPLTSADTRDAMDDKDLSNNAETAKKLLEEAGYRKVGRNWQNLGGEPLSLKLIYEKVLDPRDRDFLVAVVNQFKVFGIKVTDPYESESSLARIDFYKELKHRKTWHLALIRVYQSSNTDIDMYNPEITAKNIFNFKPSEANNANIKRLFQNYQTSRDNQRRKLKQELAMLIRDEAPAIFLWDFQATYLVNANTVEIRNNNSPATFNVLQFIDDYNLLKGK